MGQRQEKIMGPKLHKQKALQTFFKSPVKTSNQYILILCSYSKDFNISIPEPPLHCHRLVGSVLKQRLRCCN